MHLDIFIFIDNAILRSNLFVCLRSGVDLAPSSSATLDLVTSISTAPDLAANTSAVPDLAASTSATPDFYRYTHLKCKETSGQMSKTVHEDKETSYES
ncbi:unnamed protein product [Parnassius apollo]|uniref:(apollo) hypothetical protein n=1 Tax=Parnassius apollo TaxID=110799 RepID=A0A8S3XIB1_PARAO|nr:unnamed protein product [Parnassius apollo]